jgi:hypothetical protein
MERVIVDIVPEERRSPRLVERALMVEECRPQLEEMIKDEMKGGAKLAELALSLIERPTGEWVAVATTRAKLKEELEKHFPHPHGQYRGFDAPLGFIVVAVVSKGGGVTIAGMGFFTEPDGDNKETSRG